MKKFILICILIITSLACLATPTPPAAPVETVVALTLTQSALDEEPARIYLPGVVTLPPPAFGAPTQMATFTAQPSLTILAITVAPLPTVVPPVETVAPTPPPPTLSPNERTITYLVTGDATVVKIYFTNKDGATETDLFSLPFERTFVVKQGASLSLLAQNVSESGNITCLLKSNDKIIKESSASGANGYAACIDAVAE